MAPLSVKKYIRELLMNVHMMEVKSIDTPSGTSSKLDTDGPGPKVNETIHRRSSGSLLYLSASRLDIVSSVGMCAKFQHLS